MGSPAPKGMRGHGGRSRERQVHLAAPPAAAPACTPFLRAPPCSVHLLSQALGRGSLLRAVPLKIWGSQGCGGPRLPGGLQGRLHFYEIAPQVCALPQGAQQAGSPGSCTQLAGCQGVFTTEGVRNTRDHWGELIGGASPRGGR